MFCMLCIRSTKIKLESEIAVSDVFYLQLEALIKRSASLTLLENIGNFENLLMVWSRWREIHISKDWTTVGGFVAGGGGGGGGARGGGGGGCFAYV